VTFELKEGEVWQQHDKWQQAIPIDYRSSSPIVQARYKESKK
jgi:hypothetical protein